jgi:hypothetical protein
LPPLLKSKEDRLKPVPLKSTHDELSSRGADY